MTYAQNAADLINAYCMMKWPNGRGLGSGKPGSTMASTMANGEMIDSFDHVDHGSHKYIPADRLTEELGMQKGAGVFSYWKMKDGSYLLRTCPGPLAHWCGDNDVKAEWGEFAFPAEEKE